MMKHLIILCLLLMWKASAAQDFKLAGVEYRNYPTTLLGYNNAGDILFNEATFYINIPILFKDKKTIIIFGPRYDRLSYQLADSSNKVNSKNLHKLSLSFTGLYEWNDKWTAVTWLRPGTGSDFREETTSGSMLFEAALLTLKRQNPHLWIGGGVAYTNYVGRNTVVPLLFVDYKKGKHVIDAIIPSYGKYYYQLNKKHHLHLGLSFAFSSGTYNATLEPYSLFDTTPINDIVFAQFHIGPILKARFAKSIELEIFSGVAGFRRINFRDNQKLPIKLDPANNGFLQVGLYYGISK